MHPTFGLFSIPHSGTRFLMKYFDLVGFTHWDQNEPVENETFWQHHAGENYFGPFDIDQEKIFKELTLVVPLTHPHRNWISFISRNKKYDDIVNCWQHLTDVLSKHDHYLFDINCRESERKENLITMLNFLNAYTKEREELTDQWVSEWPVVNPKDTEYRQAYLQNKTLPTGYDYSKLQFAVDWYTNSINT